MEAPVCSVALISDNDDPGAAVSTIGAICGSTTATTCVCGAGSAVPDELPAIAATALSADAPGRVPSGPPTATGVVGAAPADAALNAGAAVLASGRASCTPSATSKQVRLVASASVPVACAVGWGGLRAAAAYSRSSGSAATSSRAA